MEEAISPSKAFSLYAILEWGLSDVKVLSPHLFSGVRNSLRKSFGCYILPHENMVVEIPQGDRDVLFILIPNKDGDNFIVTGGHLHGHITFNELVDEIKWKTRFDSVVS